MDPVTAFLNGVGILLKLVGLSQDAEQNKLLTEQRELIESLPEEQKVRFEEFLEKQNQVQEKQQKERKKVFHELQERLEKLLGEHQDEQKRLRRHIWGFGVTIVCILGVLAVLHLLNVHL